MNRLPTSPTEFTRVQLHRRLREFCQFALHHTTRMLGSWNANEIDRFALLAHRVFETVENDIETLLTLPVVEEDEALSERTLQQLSRCLAVAVHGFLAVKYQRGRLAPMTSSLTHESLVRQERRYHRLLMESRQAARTQSTGLIHRVLLETLDAVRRDLNFMALVMGGQPDAEKRANVAAVRVAALARKYAMLAAGCLHLIFRLTNARKAAGLRQVALRRERLRRPTSAWLAAQAYMPSAATGTSARIIARAEAISWVDGDPGYTSISVQAGAVTELRVLRRNAMRAGVARGSWVLAEGTVRESGQQAFLEIGRVAPSSHAAEVWEDYLATQVRSAYDLHPRSIDLAWELPDLRELGAHNELHGRL